MRGSCVLSSAALVAATLTSSSQAAITAFFVPIASGNGSIGSVYPAAALANDPQLQTMQTWDIIVTTDGNWASAGFQAILPTGQFFYKHALGGSTKPNSLFFSIAPALEFTSYVTSPGDTGASGAPSILGYYPEEPGPGSIGDPTSTRPGRFSFSWGDLVNDPPGTYRIVRFTWPLGSLPDIHSPTGVTSQVDPASTTFIIEPEPTGMPLLCALAAFGVRRRP